MHTRRDLLRTTAAAFGLAGCGSSGPKPNIILIMADDLGYRHLGCYGQRKIRTPHLDRMAAEGLRFTDAYAGCTVCAPSRSALMTGQHTGHTPVRGNDGGLPLPSGTHTMASMLRAAGYATGIFGKWGLGEMGTEGIPTKHGFDEALGPLHQVHAQYYYPEFLWKNEEPFLLRGNRNGAQKEYAPDAMHQGALDFLTRHSKRPFFLYVPSIIPHHEYQVPEDSLAEYRGKFKEEPFVREDRGFAPQPHPVAAFAGMVTRLDRQVGEILERVRSLGLEERTLVVFTSDNGAAAPFRPLIDEFNGSEGLRGFKTDLYEGGIRAPMIARWPGRIRSGSVTNFACASYDLMPAFAEAAGAAPPGGIDGISILPTLLGGSQKPHEYLYWETTRRKRLAQALRLDDWKAVRPAPDAPVELYELRNDPAESRDVASENAAIVRRVEKIFASCRTDPPVLVEPGWKKPDLTIAPKAG